MDFKNRTLKYLNEEEWRTRNTRDLDGLKRIQRELMRKYASGNKEIFKHDIFKIIKKREEEDENLGSAENKDRKPKYVMFEPEDQKKFITYINRIYGRDNYLTYKEFVNRMVELGTIKGDIYTITRPGGYEETNVIKKVKNIGVNISNEIGDILLDYYKNFPEEASDIVNATAGSHFKGTASFLRYNKKGRWIHISAVQTDFFNRVKAKAMKYEDKATKKMISAILAKELDTYKAMFSKLVNENPNVRYYTFSSPELARKVEHMSNASKIDSLYVKLPRELGFVEKKLDFKKFQNLKKIDEGLFKGIVDRTPSTGESSYLWFATDEMVNESYDEKLLSEEIIVDEPTKKERKEHKRRFQKSGELFLVVRDTETKEIKKFINTSLVRLLSRMYKRRVTPKEVAELYKPQKANTPKDNTELKGELTKKRIAELSK